MLICMLIDRWEEETSDGMVQLLGLKDDASIQRMLSLLSTVTWCITDASARRWQRFAWRHLSWAWLS